MKYTIFLKDITSDKERVKKEGFFPSSGMHTPSSFEILPNDEVEIKNINDPLEIKEAIKKIRNSLLDKYPNMYIKFSITNSHGQSIIEEAVDPYA